MSASQIIPITFQNNIKLNFLLLISCKTVIQQMVSARSAFRNNIKLFSLTHLFFYCLILRSRYMFRSQGPSSGLNIKKIIIIKNKKRAVLD
jgi:hypothetical protein